MIFKIVSFYQKNWMATLSIIALAFIVWHKMLGQVLLGEGYMYFNPNLDFFTKDGISIWGYDNFAKIMFDIFPPFFKDNVQAYLLLALIIAVAFFLIFYSILEKITGSKFLAFTATVFFEANYLALFEYLGAGTYQRFAQRFPNLIPIMISFYFLWKFLEKGKVGYLITSFLLWAFAVFMGHFSSLALPILVIYPVIKMFTAKITWKKILLTFTIVLSFFLISFVLTRRSEQQPRGSFIQFLQTENNLDERLLDQIPIITIPLNAISYIGRNWDPPIKEPYLPVVRVLLVPCLLMYLGGIFLVAKRLPKLAPLYISFLLSMIATMFLYMFVDTRLDVTKYFGEDRYFIFSSLFAVVTWAILIKSFFWKNEFLYKLISVFLLAVFVANNTAMIWRHFDNIQYKSEVLRNFTKHIKELSPQFEDGSIIIVPSNLQWPAAMIMENIAPKVDFQLPLDGWEKKYWPIKNKVWVFDYKYETGVLVKHIDPKKWYFINLTNDYRNGKDVKFQ